MLTRLIAKLKENPVWLAGWLLMCLCAKIVVVYMLNSADDFAALEKSATAVTVAKREVDSCRLLVRAYWELLAQAEAGEAYSRPQELWPAGSEPRHEAMNLSPEWRAGASSFLVTTENIRCANASLESLRVQLRDDIRMLHERFALLVARANTGATAAEVSPELRQRLVLISRRNLLVKSTLTPACNALDSTMRQHEFMLEGLQGKRRALRWAAAYFGCFWGFALGFCYRELRAARR